jgi:hypothetical protein
LSLTPLDVFDKIEKFFKDPHSPNEVPGDFSTLYLLRKDAWKCYGCDPHDCSETTRVLFPGAMTVFCGIDLLAKFHESDTGKVGDRFKNYVHKFFPSGSASTVDVPLHIYGLRNSLMHSFGMRDRKRAAGEVCYGIKADLDRPDDLVVELKKGEWYVVDILLLHTEFEASIEEFKKHILRTPGLHSQFEEMWDRYGSMFFNGCMLSTDENDGAHNQFLYQGYSASWEL